jgi:hypothetical protein
LPAIKYAGVPGDPGENYAGHMGAALRAWLRGLRHPRSGHHEPTLIEMRSIESRVRIELYP